MIRYIGEEGIARSEEMKHMEHGAAIIHGSAREEREEGAQEEIVEKKQSFQVQTGYSGPNTPDTPVLAILVRDRSGDQALDQNRTLTGIYAETPAQTTTPDTPA